MFGGFNRIEHKSIMELFPRIKENYKELFEKVDSRILDLSSRNATHFRDAIMDPERELEHLKKGDLENCSRCSIGLAYHYDQVLAKNKELSERERKQLFILKNFHLAKGAILTTMWTHSDQNELIYPVMVVSNDLEGISVSNFSDIVSQFKDGELNSTKETLSFLFEFTEAISRLHQYPLCSRLHQYPLCFHFDF